MGPELLSLAVNGSLRGRPSVDFLLSVINVSGCKVDWLQLEA